MLRITGARTSVKRAWRPGHPVEKRPPDILRLLFVQPLRNHGDRQRVVGAEVHALAPVGIEQPVAIEIDEAADQSAVGGVGCRGDRHERAAEPVRQFVGTQREAGHNTETAATATLDRPEQLRVAARVDDAHRAVRGDDLGFDQAARRGAVILRERAESAALDEPGDADGRAAAALHIATGPRRHRIVDVHPDRTSAHRDRRLRHRAVAAPRHECIVQFDAVHRPRPDQQRISARWTCRDSCVRRP